MLVYDYHIKKGGTLVGRHWYMNIHVKNICCPDEVFY